MVEHGPIPLPRMPEARAKEEAVEKLARIEKAIEANKVLAAIAQVPQWEALQSALTKIIESYTKAMIRQGDPVEIYRLQGSIRALSDFVASPAGALEMIEKLRSKHDEIVKFLSDKG